LEGQNTFLGGHDFCFYYIFKTNFSGNKKIWGVTKEILGGTTPECSPVAMGLCSSTGSPNVFVRGPL